MLLHEMGLHIEKAQELPSKITSQLIGKLPKQALAREQIQLDSKMWSDDWWLIRTFKTVTHDDLEGCAKVWHTLPENVARKQFLPRT